MPVTTETSSDQLALNMDSINLDATLGSLQQKLDPNLVAKVKTVLKEKYEVLDKLKVDQAAARLASLRPWSEFGNSQNFSKPKTLAEASGRISKNVRYFATNYTLVFITLFLYCLLTSPLLLIAVAVAIGGSATIMHFKENNTQIVVGGKTLGYKEQVATLGGFCIPLFWLAGAGSVVFWLLGFSAVVILGHAALLDSQMIPDAAAWEAPVRETA